MGSGDGVRSDTRHALPRAPRPQRDDGPTQYVGRLNESREKAPELPKQQSTLSTLPYADRWPPTAVPCGARSEGFEIQRRIAEPQLLTTGPRARIGAKVETGTRRSPRSSAIQDVEPPSVPRSIPFANGRLRAECASGLCWIEDGRRICECTRRRGLSCQPYSHSAPMAAETASASLGLRYGA
jgi:hypothetical protein